MKMLDGNKRLRKPENVDKNIFYVVRDTSKHFIHYYLFNGIPYKADMSRCDAWYEKNYYDGKIWVSSHGCCSLKDNAYADFNDVDHNTKPVPVRLVITDSDTPDMYIQRCGECLYISDRLESYYTAVPRRNWFLRLFSKFEWVKRTRVFHHHMISNKLFPEVTEESGIVGVNIERI